MKKVLSLLVLINFSATLSSTSISCINIEQKKYNFFNSVFDKINDSKKDSWKDNSIADANGNSSLIKNGEHKPSSWISMLTNVFNLKTNSNPDKDEMKFITNISSNDNILADGIKEDITITLTLDNKRPNQTQKTIKKTLTWHNDEISEDNLETETINAINDASNVNAKGENLSTSANNSLTTSAILNNIGLNDKQKEITTLSGNLIREKENTIIFNVNNNIINKNVGLYTKGKGNIAEKNINSMIQFNGKYYAIENGNKQEILVSDDGVNFSILTEFGSFLFDLYNFQNQLYLATGNGVYKYNGNSFITIDKTFKEYTYCLTDFNNELYAGSFNSGVYKYNGSKFIKVDNNFSLQAYEFKIYQNELYIGTHNGVFKLNNGIFQKIDDRFSDYIFSLEVYNNILYIGASEGLYKLDNNKIIKFDNNFNYNIYSLKFYDNELYIGTNNGLWELINTNLKNLNISKSDVYINLNFDHSLTLSSGYWVQNANAQNINYYYAGK